jgi:hypothetical protein
MHRAVLSGRIYGSGHRQRLAAQVLLVLGVVLAGMHLLALYQGPHWTSPLLLGDWLFTVAFAGALLLYATALGRVAARPLLGPEQGWLEDLTALGLGSACCSPACSAWVSCDFTMALSSSFYG